MISINLLRYTQTRKPFYIFSLLSPHYLQESGLSAIPDIDTTLFNIDAVLTSREIIQERIHLIADMKKKIDEDQSNANYELHSERSKWELKLQEEKKSKILMYNVNVNDFLSRNLF